ncbi:MAG: Tex family protein [Bacteroidales bacterium]|nr:Tex family protein [Bacteroidales bacterium]
MTDFALAYTINQTGISQHQVNATIRLLDDGATIPFISRYRKEVTGSLDEVQIHSIAIAYEKAGEIEQRKLFILNAIEQQGKLTDELVDRLNNCQSLNELEDIYMPFKPRRRTRAEVARRNGLEPLAKIIMSQRRSTVSDIARRYVNDEVADADAAIAGASDIIAEWVSEDSAVRERVRNAFERGAVITCRPVKGKEEAAANYRNYFDYSSPLRRCGSHRILAMRRGEKEGLLQVGIDVDREPVLERLRRRFVRSTGECADIISDAITDSYRRLIKPSIENEFAASSKDAADEVAINLFADNARQLLFAPPLPGKRILAIDPGFRTGCKVVCLDGQGNLLANDTIYPTEPRNDIEGATRKIAHLVDAYKIDAIALGNGTASRETKQFLSGVRFSRPVEIFLVSEDGASIYSASAVAREEFPDKDVTVRGAVSIGRRLLDPLAELVKIDPKSIGVGQYQYDVDQTKLRRALDFTVASCVNSVGVNLNTASKELLTYVSGLGPQLAKNIVDYRAAHGDFTSRSQLLNVPRLGAKAYEQSAGFLRIPGAKNPLDNTAVHPENYDIVRRMADDCRCSVDALIADSSIRHSIDISKYVSGKVGMPTLTDIMAELDRPGRDPRQTASTFKFDDSIRSFDDLKIGMQLDGIVTNITQFGCFVDIGIKENGLVHISELSDTYVASPSDVVKIHQHVRVVVKEIDAERRRIALTMKGLG